LNAVTLEIAVSRAVEKYLPVFESLTGIKVNWEIVPFAQARQKSVIALTARDSSLDVYTVFLPVDKLRFWKASWLSPLNPFMDDTSLVIPGYAWDDVSRTVRERMTGPDGNTILAVPAFAEPYLLFCRKDLYAQKNLAYPRTLAQLEQHAQLFTTPPDMYGFLAAGSRVQSAVRFTPILFAMGGNFLTKDGKAALDTKEFIAGLEYFARMLKRYAPPGVENFGDQDALGVFTQGKAAIYLEAASAVLGGIHGPSSKVEGKVAYVLPPSGPGGRKTALGGTGWAINPYSQHKEAAFLFLQWLTSKETCLRETLTDGIAPFRDSIWRDPRLKESGKFPAELIATYQESVRQAGAELPEVVPVQEYRLIVGDAVIKVMEGTPAAQAAAQAQSAFQQALDRTR